MDRLSGDNGAEILAGVDEFGVRRAGWCCPQTNTTEATLSGLVVLVMGLITVVKGGVAMARVS